MRTGFYLYRRTCSSSYETVTNNSIIYSFEQCQYQCQEMVLGCVYNGSNSSAMWEQPNSSISSGTFRLTLCLCDGENYAEGTPAGTCNDCYSSYNEGVYRCVLNSAIESNISFLQFTHKIYSTTNHYEGMCQTPKSSMPTPTVTLSSRSMDDCPTVCSLQETPCTNVPIISSSLSSSISSSCPSTVAEQISTTPLLTISSSCPSTVAEQISTTPHYAGIGLLVATNLITIILLISSCVYISSQRKKSKL